MEDRLKKHESTLENLILSSFTQSQAQQALVERVRTLEKNVDALKKALDEVIK